MKTLILLSLFIFLFPATAHHVVRIDTVDEFYEFLNIADDVPVVMAFTASWCGPCKRLLPEMRKVAQEFSHDQVVLAEVDAHRLQALRKYLLGGYPTVRTFYKTSLTSHQFSGYQDAYYLRHFINRLIASPTQRLFCPIRK